MTRHRSTRRRYNATATVPEVSRLVDRLDAVLSVVSYCRGWLCRNPWAVLHPTAPTAGGGAVASLAAAMAPQYDQQYRQYAKFTFLACGSYYDPANEAVDAGIRGAVSDALRAWHLGEWGVVATPGGGTGSEGRRQG